MKKMMYYRNLIIAFLLLLPTLLPAQVVQTNAKNNTVDYSTLTKIDGLVNEYVDSNWLAGAVTIVIKDNQVVQYKGYGYADLETKKPMQKDAIFRIASQTKAITTAGIMILYDQAKLLLDEPISNYIPAFKNPVVLDQFNDSDTTYTERYQQKERSPSVIY